MVLGDCTIGAAFTPLQYGGSIDLKTTEENNVIFLRSLLTALYKELGAMFEHIKLAEDHEHNIVEHVV